MKLVTYRSKGRARPGILVDDRVYDLRSVAGTSCPATMQQLLEKGIGRIQHAATYFNPESHRPVDASVLCAPVPKPGKIVAIGRNYAAHARETGFVPAEEPRIIFKLGTSVIGTGETVRRPSGVEKLDWEVELAAVIGQNIGGADTAPATATNAIAGYTIANDITAREYQIDRTPPQTSFAKSMDCFAPMGPYLATPDEMGDLTALTLRTWINDELMQEGCVADMIFPVADLVAYIARFITLEPGDVVLTGTPSGSGAFRDPPVYLQPGDRMRLEIDRLGVLENTAG